MRNSFVRFSLGLGLAALPSLLMAQPTAHYLPGVEGIKSASLPPPGVLRDYNVAYYATRVNDPSGSKTGSAKGFIYANIPRLIWITDTKVLGGFVGVDALLPLIYKRLELNPPPPASRYHDHVFGIGDLFAEATLSWHQKQFDFSAAAGVWAPTGDSGAPVRAGEGYWTPMLTAGATWYIDTNRTWAVSALNRYEFNTEQRDFHYTPGQAHTLEWGVSKTLGKVWDVGVVGYYQHQVNTDNAPAPHGGQRDRVASVGPEVSVACPKHMVFFSLRYLYEFMAEDRLQGHTFALTLTKRL